MPCREQDRTQRSIEASVSRPTTNERFEILQPRVRRQADSGDLGKTPVALRWLQHHLPFE